MTDARPLASHRAPEQEESDEEFARQIAAADKDWRAPQQEAPEPIGHLHSNGDFCLDRFPPNVKSWPLDLYAAPMAPPAVPPEQEAPLTEPDALLHDLRAAFVSVIDGVSYADPDAIKVAELAIGSIDGYLSAPRPLVSEPPAERCNHWPGQPKRRCGRTKSGLLILERTK